MVEDCWRKYDTVKIGSLDKTKTFYLLQGAMVESGQENLNR